MKKALIISGIILLLLALPFSSMVTETFTAQTGAVKNVKEGDVIFQTSQSEQSPLIQIGTRSMITHCGIVVMKGGKPYVLETQRTIVLTPFDKFIARGKDGRYWLKRSNKDNIKIKYNSYLGKPYDLAFKFDNGKFYCSELIYDIYIKQLGIELCKPKKVGDYLILGTDELPKIEKAMKKRGITKEQYAVAPVDIFNSEHLNSVNE
jgi:cell wall-associated NlpC family hydrolase